MFPDDLGLDPLAEQRLQMRVSRGRCVQVSFTLGRSRAAGRSGSRQGTEDEDVIGSAGVRVVFRSSAACRGAAGHRGHMAPQMGRRHHLDAVGAVLIGEMGIEAEAGVVPVAGVDLAGGIAAFGGTKELSVGRGGCSVTPYRGNRQSVMGVDDAGERRLVGFGADIGVGDPISWSR